MNKLNLILLMLLNPLFIVDAFSQEAPQKAADSIKTVELDEVMLSNKRKAIEKKADRTIFDFSEQAHLNSGSVMEGLKKLPGLIISEVAGMMYQGKQLEVFMDGRPLNIYSTELITYLGSMPANSIEKVEIITQPGAEFPATSGGAIINIVSSKKIKKYLSATYSNGYSYTKYDASRHKFNNSILISARNKLFGWQIQAGQNYNEGYQRSRFYNNEIVLSNNTTDRFNRSYFLKSGLKFDFNKDRLLVNYDIISNNNNSYIKASGFGFESDDKRSNNRFQHDLLLNYQVKFEDFSKNLDFKFNYNRSNNDFNLGSRNTDLVVLDNILNQNYYQFTVDFSQDIKFLEKTKFSTGAFADNLNFITKNFGLQNLDYNRSTFAGYLKLNSTYRKFDFILGSRLEAYNIHGKTDRNELIPFKQTRFFPDASVKYNILPEIFVSANYNRKINLPNTSTLNPNNTSYQNPNLSFLGNPNLSPTIYNNYEIQVSALEYFYISYNLSDINDQVVDRIISNNDTQASRINENVSKLKIHSFNLGLPIPYKLFTKGLKETLNMDFNPDEINFLYVSLGHQKYILPDIASNGYWNLNLMSQIILPDKIKFIATYNTSTAGGNYQYYDIRYPLDQQLDVSLSKSFFNKDLSLSIYLDDVFNTNKQRFNALGTNLLFDNKYDSRRVG
ncbi:MAG TPA: outer membrane beta-barrel family protein, partial [Flavobacterium sp.]|nr:outer membrane beta-barrel family protein [Flavobacterium sp.]